MESVGLPPQNCSHRGLGKCEPAKCPECGSQRIWKNGIRYTDHGEVQRYLCRSCGHRFSDSQVKVNIIEQPLVLPNPMHNFGNFDSIDIGTSEVGLKNSALSIGEDVRSHDFPIAEKGINTLLPCSRERQVCVDEKKMKNLVEVEARQKQAAGATTLSEAEIKGKVVEFMWHLKKQGYAKSTVYTKVNQLKRLIKLGMNLYDPESAKRIIAEQPWTDGTKKNMVETYSAFAELNNICWQPPEYRYREKLPFLPLETEIDTLISSCSRKMATFLQLLKETGARSGEAWSLRWVDLDTKRHTVTVEPEKHGKPRVIKVSARLVGMLNALSKESENIFGNGRLASHRCNFQIQRKRIANKLNNPRILEISFHTLRHWKATMEYHKTKDILHVKRLLGHRNIQSTLIYTHMINFESDEYHVRVAETLNEACDLLEAGFEYVTDMDDKKLFRKRK